MADSNSEYQDKEKENLKPLFFLNVDNFSETIWTTDGYIRNLCDCLDLQCKVGPMIDWHTVHPLPMHVRAFGVEGVFFSTLLADFFFPKQGKLTKYKNI